jgi:hypothetical protein
LERSAIKAMLICIICGTLFKEFIEYYYEKAWKPDFKGDEDYINECEELGAKMNEEIKRIEKLDYN